MSDILYSKALLRLAADAHGAGRLANPDATGTAFNPACGDRIVVDLALEGERIAAIAQETKACVLTQASASILGQFLNSVDRKAIEKLRLEVVRMMETGGPPPPPPFEAFAVFDAATAFPARHRCVLLPFEAVIAAFDASEASQKEPVGREP